MTGWAFINLFNIAMPMPTLASAGAAFGASLPLCALYYIGMGRFRKLPAVVARVGNDHEVVWEALEDYDQDLISYVMGYLLHSLGFQTLVYAAFPKQDAAPVIDVTETILPSIFIFMVACALLLAIVEETVKVATRKFASLRVLAVIPEFTTGICAMCIAFLYAKTIFQTGILDGAIYYRDEEESEENEDNILVIYADLLTNGWGVEFLTALYICVCFCMYCCFMTRLATLKKKKESSYCLYQAYLQFWNRYGDLVKKILNIAWPVIIGFLSEMLIDSIAEKLLENVKEGFRDWLDPLIYLFLGVVATATYVNSDTIPKAITKREEEEEGEGEGEDARSPQLSRDVPVQDIELSSEPTQRKGTGRDNTEEGTFRGSATVKNSISISQRAASKSTAEVNSV